jgi:hypothetical protein
MVPLMMLLLMVVVLQFNQVKETKLSNLKQAVITLVLQKT